MNQIILVMSCDIEIKGKGDVLKYVNEHDYANEDDLYVIINNDEVSR